MAFRFRRVHRLLKTDEFSSVFRLRGARSNTFFQVYAAPNTLGYARLGLVVGKKVAKQAVRRNYIKRTVREWFRVNQPDLPACDFVVRARLAFGHTDRNDAVTALSALFAKLARCRASSSS
ncbi:ribonuclease P protein component [Crenobacter cavernae]|uniref:Ribonuclease P protein component n=1 Tax=Crenobacter cavernae TaxID=2290923 RepID=A0ABY0FEP9_9NEIS|nr:ribonuclease P protein component [Crenobacter cavernae]RXZ43467.1 ribonuclease P protein component [Crenobacter cavernae]